MARGSTDIWLVVGETYGNVVGKVEQMYGLNTPDWPLSSVYTVAGLEFSIELEY